MASSELRSLPRELSYFRKVWDTARITQAVYDYSYPGSGKPEDPFVLRWIPNDPGNAMEWGAGIRWASISIQAFAIFTIALNSSAFSGGLQEFLEDFQTTETIITLGISLYVLGFALGPLLWGPCSELIGRQPVYFASYALFAVFNAAAVGSRNIQTLLVLRLLAGVSGAAPFAVSGGTIADVFTVSERGLAMGIFGPAPLIGPTLGPFIGGFIAENAGWKWLEGFLAIVAATIWIVNTLVCAETYPPSILAARAKKLSQMTGAVYTTEYALKNKDLTPAKVIQKGLCLPFVLLCKEPIVLLLSLYLAIIYATLYLFFSAYPIVFQEYRHWSPGVGGLPFLAVAIGVMISWAVVVPDSFRYGRRLAASGKLRLAPEIRLETAMIAAVLVPVGLFWFAWTNGPEVHWLASTAAGVPFGLGMSLIFTMALLYLIDAYTTYAASALAACALVRALLAFAFPLFAPDMYRNLGLHWASSIPAFLALICLPIPFLFYRYGHKIRQYCKYSAESEAFVDKMIQAAIAAKREAAAGAAAKSAPIVKTEKASANTSMDPLADREEEPVSPATTISGR